MANYFNPGEEKIRPGVYFNHQKKEEEVTPGAVDGIVAVLFKSSMGPLGAVTVLSAKEGYKDIYGEGGTTDVLRETFYGGASKVIAVRVGNGGKAGMASLSCESGTVEIAAKYPGAAKFTVTVREKLTNSAQKECIVYLDDMEFEKVTFAAGENEAEALKKAFEASKNFAVTVKDATGAVTAVSQTAFSGGEDPKCTNADYSAALTEVEKHYFNTICVDTTDTAVFTLVAAFLDRIFQSGRFAIAVFAPEQSQTLEERKKAAESFDSEKIVLVLNANCSSGSEELKDYKVAAYIAGIIAATPSNESLTHTKLTRYSQLNELLTNSEIEDAELRGCLVLSLSANSEVWVDSGINTLVNLEENQDAGWKKIRRVKTRNEVMYRANAAVDELVGNIGNSTSDRAVIMTTIQGVLDDMVTEGKLSYADVTEDPDIPVDGDACGFEIDVIDLETAEHIYLTYFFRRSTAVPEEE